MVLLRVVLTAMACCMVVEPIPAFFLELHLRQPVYMNLESSLWLEIPMQSALKRFVQIVQEMLLIKVLMPIHMMVLLGLISH